MFPDKAEDGVVGCIPMRTFAQDEVVESGVDSADCDRIWTHLFDAHSNILDHVRVENSISILEAWIIVAAIYFSARMHYKNRHGKLIAMFLHPVLCRLYLTDPRKCHRWRIDHFPICIISPFPIKLLQQRVGISIAFTLWNFGILDDSGKIPYPGDEHVSIE